MQKLKNLGKSILANVYFPFLVPTARKKIITIQTKALTIVDAYNWTQKFYVGPKIRGFNINFQASQIKTEIIDLLSELEKNPPQRLLEIGTATGGTLFMFTRIAAKTADIISIDLPFGRYGAGYLKYRVQLMKDFALANQKMHLLRLDSHQKATVDRLKNILNGELLDFLFIDGDHSYDGVKNDFENYYPLVRPGGIIAFHDIVDNDKDKSFGTQKFWREIKDKYQHQEFIRPGASNIGCGIGLIIKPKELKSSIN